MVIFIPIIHNITPISDLLFITLLYSICYLLICLYIRGNIKINCKSIPRMLFIPWNAFTYFKEVGLEVIYFLRFNLLIGINANNSANIDVIGITNLSISILFC